MSQILEDEEKVLKLNALSAKRMGENRQIKKEKLLHTEEYLQCLKGKNKRMASSETKPFSTTSGVKHKKQGKT